MRPKFKLRKTRTVHVAIATIMLAVPASAYALTTGAVSDSQAGTTTVINAQNSAEEFNRKLGAVLHAVSAQEFPPRR